jgi:hypothetical protein
MSESKYSESRSGYSPEKGSQNSGEEKLDFKNEEVADDKYVTESSASAGCHVPNDSKDSSDAKSSGENLTEDEIIEKLQNFVFVDEKFGKTLESFIDKHSDIMDLESDEYKLQYTTVFEEYKEVFENLLETFIGNELHISIQQVFLALKRSSEHAGELDFTGFFAQILLAAVDFDVFISMMKDSAKKKQYQNSHK